MSTGHGPHPFFYIFLQSFVYMIATFTRPSSSLRYAAVVLTSVLTWTFLSTIHDYMENRALKAIWTSVAIVIPASSFERLLLSRWSYEARGPEAYRKKNDAGKKQGEGKSRPNSMLGDLSDRFWFVVDIFLPVRGIGKPWEVKNVPRGQAPSRGAFMLRTAISTFCFFLIVTLAGSLPRPDPELISLRRVPLLTRIPHVTAEELLVRLLVVIGIGVITYSLLSGITGLCDLVFVGTGLSKPAIWRPVFGPIREIYTVRRFWGVFWHQALRQPFEGLSRFVVEDCLRIPKRTLVARYSKIFVAFFCSGLIHTGTDLGVNPMLRESRALWFFCTQPLGIMLEDAVQAMFRYWKGNRMDDKPTAPWIKLVGFVWTATFMTWSVPTWAYFLMQNTRPGIDDLLSFSVLARLLGR